MKNHSKNNKNGKNRRPFKDFREKPGKPRRDSKSRDERRQDDRDERRQKPHQKPQQQKHHSRPQQEPQKAAYQKPAYNKSPAPRIDLFGVHAVTEAWLNPARRIETLYATAQAKTAFEPTLAKAREKNIRRPEPIITDKDKIDFMCPRGSVHQGLALACKPLEEIGLQDIIIRARENQNALILILDQVTDPHNVGAILRSASAFGAAGVVMQRKHAPELTGVLAKTACGAVEHIPVAYETNLSRAIEELKEAGYFTYGLDERGEQDISNVKKGGKTALVLGAEGEGLRRLVAEHCDALLRLPTQGAIASLNVSNAAAVALYALKV